MRMLGSALVATLMLAPSLSHAQDSHVGDAKAAAGNYAKLCAACHGPRALGAKGPT